MIWFSASCTSTSLPNSVGLLAFPLRKISVWGSNRISSCSATLPVFASAEHATVPTPLALRFVHALQQSRVVEQTVGFFHPRFPQILDVLR
jgi:hypothetical protein